MSRTYTTKPKTKTVKADSFASVKSGPSLSYVTQGKVYNGEKVTVYETRDGWAKIGERRWVSMNYLK